MTTGRCELDRQPHGQVVIAVSHLSLIFGLYFGYWLQLCSFVICKQIVLVASKLYLRLGISVTRRKPNKLCQLSLPHRTPHLLRELRRSSIHERTKPAFRAGGERCDAISAQSITLTTRLASDADVKVKNAISLPLGGSASP